MPRRTASSTSTGHTSSLLKTNAEEKLEFDEVIGQISEDARFILSTDIRHGIMRVAPLVLHEEKTA